MVNSLQKTKFQTSILTEYIDENTGGSDGEFVIDIFENMVGK